MWHRSRICDTGDALPGVAAGVCGVGRSVHAHGRCAIFVLVTCTFWRLLSPTCSCRTVLVDLRSVAWLCLRLRAASPFGNVVGLQRREQSSADISARSFVEALSCHPLDPLTALPASSLLYSRARIRGVPTFVRLCVRCLGADLNR